LLFFFLGFFSFSPVLGVSAGSSAASAAAAALLVRFRFLSGLFSFSGSAGAAGAALGGTMAPLGTMLAAVAGVLLEAALPGLPGGGKIEESF
jgi:hypothetical protein